MLLLRFHIGDVASLLAANDISLKSTVCETAKRWNIFLRCHFLFFFNNLNIPWSGNLA